MKKKIKKLVLSSIALLSMVTSLTALSAAAAEPVHVKSETELVGDLGMLQGEGNGLTSEYLNKSTTRFQAAIMFLRLKGLEKEALAYKGQDNFKDAGLVYKEGQAILGYLKDHPDLGWQGPGGNLFEPGTEITAQAYYKVLLESLGYKQDTDFDYKMTLAFAEQKGLSKIAKAAHLVNANIATATIEALRAPLKGSGKTLASALADKGILKASHVEELANNSLNVKQNDAVGSYITDSKGMTLYYFTKDAADMNACVDGCLANWPIYYDDKLIVPAGLDAKDFSVFDRKDGKEQLTYKGWPLYYFVKDQQAGDIKGENVLNVWHVVNPSSGVALGTKADLGTYLTDAKGMTLYYFDKDTKGVSNCAGDCLNKWPLFYADPISAPTGVNASDFGTIVRADGSKQTTYKGFPLYYWAADKHRGDTLGQNVGNVWFVVNPDKFVGTKAEHSAIKTSKSDQLGTYLVDGNGMTLYVFTKDKMDTNACTGQCLINWPVFYDANLTVSNDLKASDFDVLTRSDGTKQSTYKGWPLYYWIKDKNPGETTGQNVSKVWFVIDPTKTEAR
ncbi:hypothetical protein [Paenibacillus sp. N3.4]|uniref:hypothetical protein n=1 Tax=Paenibacillus sp. N3.4 TaxID=2603222 RepID=UPI0011C816A9|nr:hypothetical protein [Paenibacillus sp. N3.4]TXK83834.1 hypothetical protein FU659_12175 [Paenibacillus sp. N3.4]